MRWIGCPLKVEERCSNCWDFLPTWPSVHNSLHNWMVVAFHQNITVTLNVTLILTISCKLCVFRLNFFFLAYLFLSLTLIISHLILTIDWLTTIHLILLVYISCISSWGLLITEPFQTSEFLVCVLLVVVLFWGRLILIQLLWLWRLTCLFWFNYWFNSTFLLFGVPHSF
jgi:hypothetical protein